MVAILTFDLVLSSSGKRDTLSFRSCSSDSWFQKLQVSFPSIISVRSFFLFLISVPWYFFPFRFSSFFFHQQYGRIGNQSKNASFEVSVLLFHYILCITVPIMIQFFIWALYLLMKQGFQFSS